MNTKPMHTTDPILGSLNNNTYQILLALHGELQKLGIPSTLYHYGQALGAPECLRLHIPKMIDNGILPPQIQFDNGRLIFCQDMLGVPDPSSPLYPKRIIITAVDICDPNGIDVILKSVKNWYQENSKQRQNNITIWLFDRQLLTTYALKIAPGTITDKSMTVYDKFDNEIPDIKSINIEFSSVFEQCSVVINRTDGRNTSLTVIGIS